MIHWVCFDNFIFCGNPPEEQKSTMVRVMALNSLSLAIIYLVYYGPEYNITLIYAYIHINYVKNSQISFWES